MTENNSAKLTPYMAHSRLSIGKIRNLYPNKTQQEYIAVIDTLWVLRNQNMDTIVTEDLIHQAYHDSLKVERVEEKPKVVEKEQPKKEIKKLLTNEKGNITSLIQSVYPLMKPNDVKKMEEILKKNDINEETLKEALIVLISEDPTKMIYLPEAVSIMAFAQEKSKFTEFAELLMPYINKMYPTLKHRHAMQVINNIWSFYNPEQEITKDMIKRGMDIFLEKIEI